MIKFISKEDASRKSKGGDIEQDEKKLKGVKIDKLSINKDEERHKLFIQKFQGAKEGSKKRECNPN